MSNSKRLIKAFSDAIPLGPHPDPHAEWISVRLDFVQEAIDHIDWLEKGVAEWRHQALSAQKQAAASQATARIAIGHLRALLATAVAFDDKQAASSAAEDWLISIGSEPS